jgi:TP901 family phage tail tape measure protein
MADNIRTTIEMILKDEQFKKSVKTLSGQTQKAGGKLTGIADRAKKAWLGIGIAIGATVIAIKKTIGVASEFEKAIARVASVTGGAKKELAAMAREAGKNTVFSAKESADALYFLASAGLAVTDMAKVLTPTLNFAAAAGLGIAEATDIVVGNLKVFQASMEDAGHFTDIMAQTVASANTDMQQLANALRFAGSSAKSAGISFEELNALIGALGNLGIKGGRAGVQLRQAIVRLQKPTADAQRILQKYGITQQEITDLLPTPIELFKRLEPAVQKPSEALSIFGVRQADVINLIKNGIPDIENLGNKLESAGGKAERMARIQLGTLSGAMKILFSRFQELILGATTEPKGGLIKVFENLVRGITFVVDVFSKLPGLVKSIFTGVLILTPAVFGLVKAMRILGLTMGPVGITITAVTTALAFLLPSMFDYRNIVEEIADATIKLEDTQRNLEAITKKLNDPTVKLTAAERDLLEIRQKLLEIDEERQLRDLIKLRSTLAKELRDNADLQIENVKRIKELRGEQTRLAPVMKIVRDVESELNQNVELGNKAFIEATKRVKELKGGNISLFQAAGELTKALDDQERVQNKLTKLEDQSTKIKKKDLELKKADINIAKIVLDQMNKGKLSREEINHLDNETLVLIDKIIAANKKRAKEAKDTAAIENDAWGQLTDNQKTLIVEILEFEKDKKEKLVTMTEEQLKTRLKLLKDAAEKEKKVYQDIADTVTSVLSGIDTNLGNLAGKLFDFTQSLSGGIAGIMKETINVINGLIDFAKAAYQNMLKDLTREDENRIKFLEGISLRKLNIIEERIDKEVKDETEKNKLLVAIAKKKFEIERDIEIARLNIEIAKFQKEGLGQVLTGQISLADFKGMLGGLVELRDLLKGDIDIAKLTTGDIKKFQMGSPFIGKSGLAMIHKGERVIPSEMNIPGISNKELIMAALRGIQLPTQGAASTVTNTATNKYTTVTGNQFMLPSETGRGTIEQIEELEENMNTKILGVR